MIDVGDLLGLEAGDNPHQWYSPSAVRKAIAAITAEYKRAEPATPPTSNAAEAPSKIRAWPNTTT